MKINCPDCQKAFTPNPAFGGHCPVCLLGRGSLQDESLDYTEQIADQPRPPIAVAAASSPLSQSVHMDLVTPGPMDQDDVEAMQKLGVVMPGFEFIDKLGWGGMGVVYRARQRSANRVVALKLVHKQAGLQSRWMRERFLNEAQALAKLDHPNIVPVYETGEVDGMPWFSMKLVNGGNLARRREDLELRGRRRDVTRERALAACFVKIARAVQHMHERGILHRDLKPSNILLDESGEPMITDFGLASAVGEETSGLTMTGEVIGTPAYIAPEVAEAGVKQATVRSDVYSLGVMLYELICRRLPFSGLTPLAILRAVVTQHASHPTTYNPNVSRDLATITVCCLEREPKRRYASAAAFAADLERFVKDEPIKARPVGVLERCLKWARRRPRAALAASLAFIGIVGGGSFSAWQWWRVEQANAKLTTSLRISTAQRLAATVDEEMKSSPTRGMLVAAEAVEITTRADGTLLPAAHQALLRAVAEVGGHLALPPATNRTCLQQSTEGEWLAAGHLDGSLLIKHLVVPESQPFSVTAAHRGPVRALAWIPGKLGFFSGGEDGKVLRWKQLGNRDWQPAEHPASMVSPAPAYITALTVSSDARRLGVCSAIPLPAESLATGPLSIHGFPNEETVPETQQGLLRLFAISGSESMLSAPLPFRTAKSLSFTQNVDTLLVMDQRRGVPLLAKLANNHRKLTPLPLPDLPRPVHHAELSQNGRWLATSATDRRVRLYDLAETEAHEKPLVGQDLGMFATVPEAVAISPDEATLSISSRHNDRLHVYRLDTISGLASPLPQKNIGFHVVAQTAFTPDGKWLVATGGDSSLRVLGAGETQLESWSLRGPESGISTLHIAPRGPRSSILAGLHDGSAWVWEFEQNTDAASPRRTTKLNRSRVMVSLPNQKDLLLVDRQEMKLISVPIPARGTSNVTTLPYTTPNRNTPKAAAVSPDGKWVSIVGASNNPGQILLHPLPGATAQPVVLQSPLADSRVLALAWHPDGRLFVCVSGPDDSQVRLLMEWRIDPEHQTATVEVLRKFPLETRPNVLTVSGDGGWLVTGTNRITTDDRQDQPCCIKLCDLRKGDISNAEHWRTWTPWPDEGNSTITLAVFSADHRYLALAGTRPEVLLLDLTESDPGKTMRREPFGAGEIKDLAFSPDGKYLLVVDVNMDGHLWQYRQPGFSQVALPTSSTILKGIFPAYPAQANQLLTLDNQGWLWKWDLEPQVLLKHAQKAAGRKFAPLERKRFGLD